MYTGATAASSTEKGAIFTGGFSNLTPNDFCMRATQSSNAGPGSGDLIFYTQGNIECMRIKGSGVNGSQPGYIGVNRRFPLSMVHIDGAPASTNPNSTFAAGWRPWMRVGVFSQWDSDGLFVGLKDEGTNRKDAVIAWSDDPASSGADYLRFIYTNNTTASIPQGGGPDGIEAGRWSPLNGYLGIGNFYNSTVTQDPAARLEILPNPLVPANTPIFRLTQVQQNPASPINTGMYADMYASTSGDLVILPRDNTQANSATSINKNRFIGINTGTPGNTVEINSQLISPTAGPGGTGNSGLRFSDLNTTSATITNPGTGVLALNASGDVIYVPAGGGFPFGGACGNTNTMTADFEIPMGTFNYVFSGQGTGTNVGIGMPAAGCSPTAKLEVHQNSTAPSPVAVGIDNAGSDGLGIVLGVNGSGTNHAGILSTVQGASNANTGFISTAFGGTQTNGGIYKASGGSVLNIGVRSDANSGPQNFAFFDDMLATGATLNVGIASRVEGGATNYGGRFNASGATGVNYGIRASATGSGPGPNYAGWFDGDIGGTGAFLYTSDQSLKQNIDSISNALNIVNLLLPKTFFFDTVAHPDMGFSSKKQWGFIAQDVETVLPELVGETTLPAEYDSLGNIIEPALTFKTLNYNAFIAILMKGMQEQQSKIDSLALQMAGMQSQINGCCSSEARIQNPNHTNVTLSNSESVVLNQNVPNPFAEQTTITYNLPESAKKAQLLFYDATGKLIKSVDLEARGEGRINVFANDLSNGIYSYALVVDGQIADTKRMVKTQ